MPARPGHWLRSDPSVTAEIAKGIVVDEQAVTRGISSVPAVWARALMFRSALRPNSQHPLRARLLREWRGLLSVLALCRVKNYEVEVLPVSLDDGTFSKAIRRLAPRAVQLERETEYAWTDIFLIRLSGIPVGALSPATLVYTGADYRHALGRVDLLLKDDDGYLRPPEGPGELEELRSVGVWLEQLQARLTGGIFYTAETNRDLPVVNGMNTLLSGWLGEIRLALGLEDAAEIESPVVIAGNDMLPVGGGGIGGYRVYAGALRPLQPGEVDPPSELLMRVYPRAGRAERSRSPVVVVTDRLLRRDRRIWRFQRLRDLGGSVERALAEHFGEASGTRIGGEALADGAMWVRPEKYFLTDELVEGEGGAFLNAREAGENSDCRYLLPFRSTILDHFSPREVRDYLQPTYTRTEEGVRFAFTLPMGSGEEEEEEERVERMYEPGTPSNTGNGRLITMRAPAIDVFPDYLGPHWRRHYVIHSDATRLTVRRPVGGGPRGVKQAAKEMPFLADPDKRGVARVVELSGDNAFPDALSISDARNPRIEYGLILLDHPEDGGTPAGLWRVGVDYGTSNTNVFIKDSSREIPECWSVELGQLARETTASESSLRDGMMAACLAPVREVKFPVPTLLRVHDRAKLESLILDYFMYLGAEYVLPDNVYSEIKWDSDHAKTECFLESLLFVILADAASHRVAEIEFAYSYPKAFTLEQHTLLGRAWDLLLEKVFTGETRVVDVWSKAGDETVGKMRISGVARAGDPPALRRPFSENEARAAGVYFASPSVALVSRAHKAAAAICLDVGGATTDISVWYRDAIISDASITLAGRQISQLFRHNPALCQAILPSAAKALDARRKQPAYFAACLNLVLRDVDSSIAKTLVKESGHRALKWLRRMLAFEFGAIAFYAALLAAAAERQQPGSGDGGVPGPESSGKGLVDMIREQGINLHWGGNASKFMRWIEFGQYDEEMGTAAKILRACFLQGLGACGVAAGGPSKQLQSPGHKHEVAGGLVMMHFDQGDRRRRAQTGGELGVNGVEAAHVCGEDVILAAGSLSALDRIRESSLFTAAETTYRGTSMRMLRAFIEAINQVGVGCGLFGRDQTFELDADDERIVANQVTARFEEAKSLRNEQRVVEPVFVTEINMYLDIQRSRVV